MSKLLSVIVPSYNMEKYLHKCLGSFGVEQLMERKGVDGESLAEKLEVIVVNDGSKDRTSEIAHEFERMYSNIYRVIDKGNGNHGSCVNVGLASASGTFVRVLDADDTFESVAFSEYLSFLDALESGHPHEVDLVVSDYVEIGPDGAILKEATYGHPREVIFTPTELARGKLYQALAANCYRTENVRLMGYQQTEGVSYSDNEWRFIPLMTVKKIVYFPKVVYQYLIGRSGQSMQRSLWRRNSWMLLKVVERLWCVYHERKNELDTNLVAILRRELLLLTTLLYSSAIFFAPKGLVLRQLLSLDKQILSFDEEVFHQLGELVVFGRYFPVRYVMILRRFKACRWGSLCMLRIGNCLYECLATCTGRRK